MTSCPNHPFGDPEGLACTRDAAEHEPGHGCTYESTSGVPDRHDTGVADE